MKNRSKKLNPCELCGEKARTRGFEGLEICQVCEELVTRKPPPKGEPLPFA